MPFLVHVLIHVMVAPILSVPFSGDQPPQTIRRQQLKEIARSVRQWNARTHRGKIPDLLSLLRDEQEPSQVLAVEALTRIAKDSTAAKLRVAELESCVERLLLVGRRMRSDSDRKKVVICLTYVGLNLGAPTESRVISFLTDSARSENYDIARFSLIGLGKFESRSKEAIPVILDRLKAGGRISLIAADAIGEIQREPEKCIPALIAAFDKADTGHARIVRALMALQPEAEQMLQLLDSLLMSRDRGSQITALVSFAEFGGEARSRIPNVMRLLLRNNPRLTVVSGELEICAFATLCALGKEGRQAAASLASDFEEFRLYGSGYLQFNCREVLDVVSHSALRLKILKLRDSGLTDDDCQLLQRLHTLEELELPIACSDASLTHLADLHRLKKLTQAFGQERSHISDVGFSKIAGLMQLRVLKLNARVQANELAYLEGLDNLEFLSLRSVSDRGMEKIPEFSRLTTLELSGHGFTDASVQYLSRLERLQHLSVGGSAIGDAGIALLASKKSKTLLSLDLSNTGVSKDSLPSLCKFSRLARLNVYRTDLAGHGSVLTRERTQAVDALIRRLPQCKITYLD